MGGTLLSSILFISYLYGLFLAGGCPIVFVPISISIYREQPAGERNLSELTDEELYEIQRQQDEADQIFGYIPGVRDFDGTYFSSKIDNEH